ncbi:MAG TPA: aromatic amino acid lyase [Geminicoccus sp.]|uniref:HAL/PAL/TAL family ammonia-lyase n=1 Tax=Geminicoccus sp. TaxID=2024832 RepID=UPI002E3694BA|nr:aromatic amino acid lyase [Geminicoccus sp.]HEX2525106.1 aromatic amino acid lyase [Geminicoccus sp.]
MSADDIVLLAGGRARIEADPGLLDRLAAARRTLEQVAASGQRIYGLNTGLGAKVGLDVADAPSAPDLSGFQNRLVRGRAIGVGEPMPTEAVRAIMAARLATLAQGGSGISPHVFQALLAMLEAGVHPLVPQRGSLGEGDLGLLAHVALVLIGEGQAEYQGELSSGGMALQRAGLAPVQLGAKDGLSLINASAVSVATGALVAREAADLAAWQEQAGMLGFAAIRANPLVFDHRVQQARSAAGQVSTAARLRHLLAGTTYEAVALQDPLSFRCLASISSALHDAVERALGMVAAELNSAADNPLVLQEPDQVVSTGNFATPAFALAFENLGLAVAHAAQAGAARFVHLSNGQRASLPRSLSPHGGTAAGFVPLQKTVMALLADLHRHAAPVMLDVMPVSEGVEDHATQSPLVVEKTASMLDAWRHLIAIELFAAAQAADLQPDLRLGGALRELHEGVREKVPFLDEDRPLGPDAQRLHDWMAAGDAG